MSCFVTGGSGFLGRSLLPYLVQHGEQVRALARSEASAATVSTLGATAALGDLDDVEALARAMAGCDVVVHAAASTAEWGPYSGFYDANVRGTENALEAAQRAGVRRFVHVSTEAVLLDGAPLVNVDEQRPLPKQAIGDYPNTKLLAERAALGFKGPPEVVVVRPRFIWGAGDTTILPKLVESVKSGRFAWIGGGTALTSTCHVANVCEGILLAAKAGEPGRVYFLTDGAPVRFKDFLTALLATQGVTPGDRAVPYRLALLMAAATEGLWRLLRIGSPPPLQKTAVLLIGREVTVNDARARAELGYRAHLSREEGLRQLDDASGR